MDTLECAQAAQTAQVSEIMRTSLGQACKHKRLPPADTGSRGPHAQAFMLARRTCKCTFPSCLESTLALHIPDVATCMQGKPSLPQPAQAASAAGTQVQAVEAAESSTPGQQAVTQPAEEERHEAQACTALCLLPHVPPPSPASRPSVTLAQLTRGIIESVGELLRGNALCVA